MRLATVLLFAVTASFLHSIPMLAVLIALTAALAAASRVPLGSFTRKVWGSAGFFGVLLAAPSMTAWISPGAVLVPLGPASITLPGVLIATRLVLRVAAGAGIGLLVVWTTRWSDLLGALTSLHVPEVVVATLAMTQQQIVSLMRTVENIHLARESRMLSAGSVTANRLWVVDRMAFVARKSLRTADDVYDAMLARGFAGAWPSIRRLKLASRDWLWLAACVAVCIVTVGLDRMVTR